MGFSGDFSPFNSPGRSFGKDLDKLREPLSEASKKSGSVSGEAALGASAADMVRSLVMRVVEFDKALPSEQETSIRLFAAGAEIELVLEDVASLGTSVLVFSGQTPAGASLEVVQHVSQLNFVLAGRARPDPAEPKPERRFHTRHADLFEKLAAKEEAAPTAPSPPAAEP
jgi:hypothetical protein